MCIAVAHFRWSAMSFGERSARFIPPRHPWIPAICESRWERITGEMASDVDKASQPHFKTPNTQIELVSNLVNISERSILRSGMNILEVNLGSPINSLFARAPKNVRSNFMLPNQRGTLRETSNMIIRYPGDVTLCTAEWRTPLKWRTLPRPHLF